MKVHGRTMKPWYTELPWTLIVDVHPLTWDSPISNGASVPNVVLPTATRVPRTAGAWAASCSTAGTEVVSTT